MKFRVTDEHVADYHRHGCTILRSVLPTTLLSELRAAAEAGRQLALNKTEIHGEQVLTPLGTYADELDLKPFEKYIRHPPFVEAIQAIIDHDAGMAVDGMGILYEPRSEAMCTDWHRDIPDVMKKWDPFRRRMTMCNASFNCRINCALYADSSTSFVPGSHARPETASEQAVIDAWPDFDAVYRDGAPTPMSAVEKELACIEYCRAMPGAVQFLLEPGDIVLYTSYGLHFAHRSPYRKRATLHHAPILNSREAWIREHVEIPQLSSVK